MIVKVPFLDLEFFFERNSVGLFEEFKYPTKDGEYSYQPYRGFGHLKMWQTIKEKGSAVSYYINKNEKISFKVKNAGKHGKLLLSEFSSEII